MSDISLTASMRTNLLALQNTQSLVSRTQERLSTGLKVNSALDNASSYYTARSLNNRASDLSSLLDSMGQGIQTIKAASEGIESITSFVEQAKAVANSARDTSDAKSRDKYLEQFNEILDQIDTMAKDSSYKGVNLLNGESLTITFNETINNPSKVDIEGEDATSAGLGLTKAEGWAGSDVTLTAEEEATAIQTAMGNAFKVTVGGAEYTVDATKGATDEAVAGAIADYKTANTGASDDEATAALKAALGDAITAFKASDEGKAAIADAVKAAAGPDAITMEEANENISKSLAEVSDAVNKLRDYASKFGNYSTIVQTRQEFTKNLVNVLTEGADNLTLADMNEESANMLALQTRQQLGINSLSLASQAAQSVLSLF